MKKYFMLLFVFSGIHLFAQPHPSFTGTGTVDDPYLIWNKAQLKILGDSVDLDNTITNPNGTKWHVGKHFKLMQNIDNVTESIGWRPFCGHFQGNGKTITLAINYDYPDNRSSALFVGLSNYNASIDNLIVDGYVNDGFAGIVYAGGGEMSSITNCVNNATVTGWSAGGIIHTNRGTISNCINNGDITGVNIVGGIVGDNAGTIINCINTGNVTATNSGSNTNLVGEITPNNGVGGIVGCVSNYCQGISNCINIGTIKGQDVVGGINGGLNRTSITNCINAGYVAGWGSVGGIGGVIFNFYGGSGINNCVNVGVVEGEEDIGSIVGKE